MGENEKDPKLQISFDGDVVGEDDVEEASFIDEGPQVEGGSV